MTLTPNSYGHTFMKIPALVRSRKSSMKRSSQYCGGRPRGNTGCCSFCTSLLFFLTHTLLILLDFAVVNFSIFNLFIKCILIDQMFR